MASWKLLKKLRQDRQGDLVSLIRLGKWVDLFEDLLVEKRAEFQYK